MTTYWASVFVRVALLVRPTLRDAVIMPGFVGRLVKTSSEPKSF